MKTVAYLALAGFLTMTLGCSSALKVADFKELACDKKECDIAPPDYIVSKKKPRVAILNIEDTTEFEGKLSKPAVETLSQAISHGFGIEVVERGQVNQLFKEAKFSETLGLDTDFSKLTNVAKDIDFVLVGSIPSASVGAKYTAPSSYVDKKGKTHYIAASCNVSGASVVNIRVISTATGTVSKVFKPFKGSASGSSEVPNSSSCNVGNPLATATLAVTKAIENGKDDLHDAFPNYGYISKTLTNPQDNKSRIAYISLGKNDGVKIGDKLIIAKYVKSYDKIKKKT